MVRDLINIDFKKIYDDGEVLKEESYHQPQKSGEPTCGCSLTTSDGAYRDVVVKYDGDKYYFYHQTAVVIKSAPYKYQLNNGGYKTKSTKRRINTITPSGYKLKSIDTTWHIVYPDDSKDEFMNGKVLNVAEDTYEFE